MRRRTREPIDYRPPRCSGCNSKRLLRLKSRRPQGKRYILRYCRCGECGRRETLREWDD